MYFVTTTLLCLLLAASVQLQLTQLKNERVENLKRVFCDVNNHGLNQDVDDCFLLHPLHNDELTMQIARECYAGVAWPVTGTSSRDWHCNDGRSDGELLMAHLCMDESFQNKHPSEYHIISQAGNCLREALERHTGITPQFHQLY